MSGFTFGKTPADNSGSKGGFSFGGAGDAAAPAQAGFNFGGGTTTASSSSAFGSSPTPAFGSSLAPASGSSAPAFGSSSTPAFGSTTAFGGSKPTGDANNKTSFSLGGKSDDGEESNKKPSFGDSKPIQGDTKPAFGDTPTFGGAPAFGAAPTAAAPAFGGAPATTTAPALGGATTTGTPAPAFGGAPATTTGTPAPAFGGAPATTTGTPAPAFGGAPATTAAPAFGGAATTTGTPAPAFGGAPATTTGTPAPSFGGASAFGAAPTPTQGTTTDPKTPVTPGAPAPVATPAGTTAAAPTPVALEYKTLSVEQILNKFQKELERDILVYKEQARVVAERDAVLRDSQRDIQTLTNKLHRCLVQQSELDKTVSSITAFQDEMEHTLTECEASVNELFVSQGNVTPVPSDFERENIFKAAEEVESRLQQVEGSFEFATSQLNEGLTANLDSDVAAMMTVLFQHQLALQEIEQTSNRMQREIDEAEKVLSRTT